MNYNESPHPQTKEQSALTCLAMSASDTHIAAGSAHGNLVLMAVTTNTVQAPVALFGEQVRGMCFC